MMFIYGFAAVGRCSIGFLYLIELIPDSHKVIYGTIIHFANALVGLIGCLYFWKVSKNCLWLEIGAWALNLSALAGVMIFLRESPKYLIGKKRYDDARKAMNQISMINLSDHFIEKFENESKDL